MEQDNGAAARQLFAQGGVQRIGVQSVVTEAPGTHFRLEKGIQLLLQCSRLQ